ncbi:hypothetical protein D3C79_674810 [compost metagenome]
MKPVFQGIPEILMAVSQAIGVELDLHLGVPGYRNVTENLQPKALIRLQVIAMLDGNKELILKRLEKQGRIEG